MRVFYDTNNFVWAMTIDPNLTIPGYSAITIDAVDPSIQLFNAVNGLPRYKIVNDTIVEIVDFDDYLVDARLKSCSERYLHDEVQELIYTKTDDELKAIYDASPECKQDLIYEGIEEFWSKKLFQHKTNLSVEVLLRVIFEMLYIKDVEKREFTADEKTAYENILQAMKDHSSVMKNTGTEAVLDSTAWYHDYLHAILGISDTLRAGCIPQRFYVTGRY